MSANLGEIVARAMERPAESRTIEAITTDLLDAKRRGGEAILTIGRCLIEAKDMLPHGEWLPWLNEKAEFSERTARNFMRLAREWTNRQALADLGASKALTLLALPADEREQFMADNNVVDMTTRQLEEAIRDRDEARKAAEAAQAEARTAEEARAKLAQDMAVVNASLESARAADAAAQDRVRELEEELRALRDRPVDVAVETVVDQEAVEAARKEAIAEMQAKLDKAREAKDKAEARRKNAEDALEQVRRQLEEQAREEKKAALGADKDLAQFELLFAQAQETVNKMAGILLKVRTRDADAAGRLANAIRALAEAVGRCAE